MVSATTITAVNGLSGFSFSPASAATTTPAANHFIGENMRAGSAKSLFIFKE